MSLPAPPFEVDSGLVVWIAPWSNVVPGGSPVGLPVAPGQSSQAGSTAQTTSSASTTPVTSSRVPIKLGLPAIYTAKERNLRVARPVMEASMQTFLKQELDLSRLNCLHKHLWVAGLPQPPRPLHRQLQIGRSIRVTESADMHMVWHQSYMFLKPLPDFLLCHKVWVDYICPKRGLYDSAIGFLLSYVWLICYPSDHRIAVVEGLINKDISWEQWSTFVGTLVSKGILNLGRNPRFGFGELRLGRLIWICRLCSLAKSKDHDLLRHYSYASDTYTSFFQKNLSWLVSVFVYITIVLTAMQVGLASNYLSKKEAFQRASWGFTVFSIIGPLVVVLGVGIWTLIVIFKNFVFSKSKKGKPTVNDACWQQQEMDKFKH